MANYLVVVDDRMVEMVALLSVRARLSGTCCKWVQSIHPTFLSKESA